jgi:bifunctional non-homologous end joining protein LigD
VALVRAPQGIDKPVFFQKHIEATPMPGLRELDKALWPEHAPLLGVPTADAIVSAAQMNVVEFHTGNASVRANGRPNRIVFDLDPGEGTAWPHVREGALLVRTMLQELGWQAWLKTSGGKGLHVVVPVAPKHDDETLKALAQAVVQHLAATIPQRFVAKSGPSNRVGKLYVDYLRNGRGQTTASAYSARSRPGLGVSMPIAWEALPELKSGAQWTVATAREHLSFQGDDDPWAGYWTSRQSAERAAKVLGVELPAVSTARASAKGAAKSGASGKATTEAKPSKAARRAN